MLAKKCNPMFPDKKKEANAKSVTMILEDTENNLVKRTENLRESQGLQPTNLVINTNTNAGSAGLNASFTSKNGSTAYTFT